jgi:hypothetical protein
MVFVPALWRLRAVSTRLTVKDFRALASGKCGNGENNLGVSLADFVRGFRSWKSPEIRLVRLLLERSYILFRRL